jgi:hypothetical protein
MHYYIYSLTLASVACDLKAMACGRKKSITRNSELWHGSSLKEQSFHFSLVFHGLCHPKFEQQKKEINVNLNI